MTSSILKLYIGIWKLFKTPTSNDAVLTWRCQDSLAKVVENYLV